MWQEGRKWQQRCIGERQKAVNVDEEALKGNNKVLWDDDKPLKEEEWRSGGRRRGVEVWLVC